MDADTQWTLLALGTITAVWLIYRALIGSGIFGTTDQRSGRAMIAAVIAWALVLWFISQ